MIIFHKRLRKQRTFSVLHTPTVEHYWRMPNELAISFANTSGDVVNKIALSLYANEY
jgi:hypothetical protein